MRRKRALLLFLGCLLHAAVAGATVLVPTDLAELSRDAGLIARGRVVAVESRWADGRRAIETVVTLQVDASLKGAMNPTVQWTVPGGTVGRFRRLVVGAPEFVVGQRVIVFLGGRPPGYPYLLGFGQGVFRVVASADASGWAVIPPPVSPSATTVPVVRGDVARRPVPLEVFEQRIRSLVAGQR